MEGIKMIIDEILDSKELKKPLDIEYIKKEALIFGFVEIIQAIKNKSVTELKIALKNYIKTNNYNSNILKDIDKIKINY